MRIALFQPDIPQNTGNILRLAACLGLGVDIIEPAGFIFDDKRFLRSLMDYKKKSNYKKHLDWKVFSTWYKSNGFRIILMTTYSNKKYLDYKFNNNDILLFGRESAGVPEKIHACVDERLTIPMTKGVRSINVSSAVALIVGEACRQLKLFN